MDKESGTLREQIEGIVKDVGGILHGLISAIFGLFIIYMIGFSAIEIGVRLVKPEERYLCTVTKLNDDGAPFGSPIRTSLRIEWPLNLPNLWVKHSGRALFDEYPFDNVFEGEDTASHILRGSDYDPLDRFFTLDRISGSFSYIERERRWMKGTCKPV